MRSFVIHSPILCALLIASPLQAQRKAVASIAVRQLLEISGSSADGTIQLEAPVAATMLSSGVIVVAEPTKLRRFSADGSHIGDIGRSGRGPLEFGRIHAIVRCSADVVVVLDLPRRSLFTLAPNGTLAFAVNFQTQSGTQLTPTDIACDGSGSYLAIASVAGRPTESAPGVVRASAAVYRARQGVWKFDSVVVVPSSEMLRLGGGGLPRPLGKHTSIGVTGSTVVVATGDTSVRQFAADGRESLFTVSSNSRSISTSDRESAINDALNSIPGQMRSSVRGLLNASQWPTLTPPYQRIAQSTNGELWFVVPPTTPGTTELTSPSTNRAPSRRIVLPMITRAVEVGRNYVLALGETPEGEPLLRVYARDQ